MLRDEMLYREGDPKEEVFFFGDIEIIMDAKRQYFVATKSEVVLLVCKSNHF